ncbi:MAG: pyruvate, phosphate dikinase, partial [Candidatus Bathyarchaeota archaeon]|nr:pyruvate, phosphate dikinase [Candidatus Bathyarchaeota archaeon]
KYPEDLQAQIDAHLSMLEKKMGKRLGDLENPLLVSVRSGAPQSMPGMMDTVLNLGLNDVTVKSLANQTQNERFAYDCYRRFMQMFGNVVIGLEHGTFEAILSEVKGRYGVTLDTDMSVKALKDVVAEYKKIFLKETGETFQQEPHKQLSMSIDAVFKSWNNRRAITYRKLSNIPDDIGTAVNVQTMVYGNMGEDSGTGVAFTRDPATGGNELYGEYLMNAQGEDVVAGIRTPRHVRELKKDLPDIYENLVQVCETLEKHYRDVQDLEFTIEKGIFYILQTRTGKRTIQAAVKIAVDLAEEGLITQEEAILRVNPSDLDRLLHPTIDPEAKVEVLATGIAASPGAASGMVVFDADEAEAKGNEGLKVVLVRPETTPEDIHGLAAAQGVLTSTGGMTCHAAIVARAMGKPCVAGCKALQIDLRAKSFEIEGRIIKEGDIITIDGTLGNIILGEAPTIDPEMSEEFDRLLKWADHVRTLGVMANADTPENARMAREYGAEGIGLCRTERMFNDVDRLPIVQEMILADTDEAKRDALNRLMPMQKKDFKEILKVMEGLPVIIRLLDPPLHEFLPRFEDILTDVTTRRLKGEKSKELEEKEGVLRKVRLLSEANPMLGFRACRLGIVNPEIYEMQVRAILETIVELTREGYDIKPKIMIPGVGNVSELKFINANVRRVAKEIEKESGIILNYELGTMIELPRACVTADEIAKHAEFFSFGTNDLTQTTFGWSRDDAEGKFVPQYIEEGVITVNPFAQIDVKGVGALMQMCVDLGRSVNKDLEIGICGEHGGNPESIRFCYQAGLDYVSCSPFRVPIARLAAAQETLKDKSG